MIRAWAIFFVTAVILWIARVVMWTDSGTLAPLTVSDVLGTLGLSPRDPPPTDLGMIAANLLGTDGGFFFLFLTLAALAFDALLSKRN